MIDLMRPLYRMMEAKGLPQVRVRPLSAEAIALEEAREAAQGIAAALTAAAGAAAGGAAGGAAAPARKPGQHKVDRHSKKARSQKPVARRAVVMRGRGIKVQAGMKTPAWNPRPAQPRMRKRMLPRRRGGA